MSRVGRLYLAWLLALAALSVALPASAAELPELSRARQQIDAGNTLQADRSMAQLLAANPQSAQTHYLEALLLAKETKWPLAAAELRRAEELDPTLRFASAEDLQALRAQLAEHRKAARELLSNPGRGLLAVVFLLVSAYLMFSMWRARRAG